MDAEKIFLKQEITLKILKDKKLLEDFNKELLKYYPRMLLFFTEATNLVLADSHIFTTLNELKKEALDYIAQQKGHFFDHDKKTFSIVDNNQLIHTMDFKDINWFLNTGFSIQENDPHYFLFLSFCLQKENLELIQAYLYSLDEVK